MMEMKSLRSNKRKNIQDKERVEGTGRKEDVNKQKKNGNRKLS